MKAKTMKGPTMKAPQLILALAVVAAPALAQGKDLLVKAHTLHIASDKVLNNSAILIRAGKVLFLGDEIPKDLERRANVIEFKGTLVPGFIDCHANLGHGNQLAERIDAFTPELMAADAFDPFVKELGLAAQAGVTTAVLSPQSYNTFAGQAAVVQTGEIGKVIADSTYLKMSFVQDAFDQNRYPTSRMGAADMIRTSFGKATGPLGASDAKLKILNEVASGSRKAAFHASTSRDIAAALAIANELSLAPILMGAEEAHKHLDRIKELKASVVLAPLTFMSPMDRLTLPAELEKRGVPFAFMAERPQDLRLSAALAVRHGLSRKAALRALTEGAARLLAADSQVGNLYQGKAANFCVYSGHPLDLTSRLLAVYVAGSPVTLEKKEASK